MLHYISKYPGKLKVNGVEYTNVAAAIVAFQNYDGTITLELNYQTDKPSNTGSKPSNNTQEIASTDIYEIKVRQYMTRPASVDFDFHTKWNEDKPMPMRVMTGRKLKETRGMVKMELWGDITNELTTHCMKCGRVLTNPVSKYFGIGPECGQHNYNNPFATDEELKAAVKEMKEQLNNIRWTGWVIKSAIESERKIN